jgi:hypothetical protein
LVTPIRFRLLVSCFLLVAGIVFVVDLTGGTPIGFRRALVDLLLGLVGSLLMTAVFTRSLAWRVQRLKLFTEHVLDANNPDAPLPDEGEETAVLNQSFHRMVSRIRELVERLSLESNRRENTPLIGLVRETAIQGRGFFGV